MNESAQYRLRSPQESYSASTRPENRRQSTRGVPSLLVARLAFTLSSRFQYIRFASYRASVSRIIFRFSQITFLLNQNKVKTTSKVDAKSRGKAGGKVMRKKEPVLLVLSVCDGEIILEKGEILFEKRHIHQYVVYNRRHWHVCA
jgi:hypothetical protein